MGEEAPDDPDFLDRINGGGVAGESDGEDWRVLEWEIGLPNGDELTPLSQSLITPELASAFSINPEPARSLLDVHRASQHTISNLRRIAPSSASTDALRSFHPFPSPPSGAAEDDPMISEESDTPNVKDGDGDSSSRKIRTDSASPCAMAAAGTEEAETYSLRPDNSNDENSARMLKRQRLVWTPQLHKRFVDVVAHLGIQNAVPKTIMQLMNVEGLSRENVASHLQKYRLYLKRMQGLSNEGPSFSDQLFASTPVPQSLHEQQVPVPMPTSMPIPMPIPYAMPGMFPVPIFGIGQGHGSQIGVVTANNHHATGPPQGYEPHQLYGALGEPNKDWSGGKRINRVYFVQEGGDIDKRRSGKRRLNQ